MDLVMNALHLPRNLFRMARALGKFGLCGIAVSLIMAVGCSDGRLKTYPIRGEVVFADGTPVKMGTIETKSVQHGVQATGSIASDGTFQLTTYESNDGAVDGDHRCVLVQFVPTENIPNYRPSTMGVVHRKHSAYATSDLGFAVTQSGENRVRLVVQGADPISRTTDDHGHDAVPAPEDETLKK
jgi:hypothetical protein